MPVPVGSPSGAVVWHLVVVTDRRGIHYEQVGWPFTADAEAAVAAYAGAHPPGRFGRHEPDPDAYGLDLDDVRERFASYTERFDVEPSTEGG